MAVPGLGPRRKVLGDRDFVFGDDLTSDEGTGGECGTRWKKRLQRMRTIGMRNADGQGRKPGTRRRANRRQEPNGPSGNPVGDGAGWAAGSDEGQGSRVPWRGFSKLVEVQLGQVRVQVARRCRATTVPCVSVIPRMTAHELIPCW